MLTTQPLWPPWPSFPLLTTWTTKTNLTTWSTLTQNNKLQSLQNIFFWNKSWTKKCKKISETNICKRVVKSSKKKLSQLANFAKRMSRSRLWSGTTSSRTDNLQKSWPNKNLQKGCLERDFVKTWSWRPSSRTDNLQKSWPNNNLNNCKEVSGTSACKTIIRNNNL